MCIHGRLDVITQSNSIRDVFLFSPGGKSDVVRVYVCVCVVVPLGCLLSKHADHRDIRSWTSPKHPPSGFFTFWSSLAHHPDLHSLPLSHFSQSFRVLCLICLFCWRAKEENKTKSWVFAAGVCLERFKRFSSVSLGGVRSVLHIDPLCRRKTWHWTVWGVWSPILAWGRTFFCSIYVHTFFCCNVVWVRHVMRSDKD